MATTPPANTVHHLPTTPAPPRNGLGVAALVIGVASLVAAISFILFPLALVAGLVGLVIGIVALARGRQRGATNRGQAIAGVDEPVDGGAERRPPSCVAHVVAALLPEVL
jgi:hypothetical protein